MTKEDKQNLADKKLTDTLIISCLAACEPVISRNAYLEKKWSNCYRCGDIQRGSTYYYERLEWMNYRERLRSLLLPTYSMKVIIQMTKSCTDKATQKEVREIIGLMDKGDYTLL